MRLNKEALDLLIKSQADGIVDDSEQDITDINVFVNYDHDLAQFNMQDTFEPESNHEYVQILRYEQPLIPALTALGEMRDYFECIENELDWWGHDMVAQIQPEEVCRMLDYYIGKDWQKVGEILDELYGEHHTISRGYCQGDAYHVIGKDVAKNSKEINNLLWNCPIRASVTFKDSTLEVDDYVEIYLDEYLSDEYTWDVREISIALYTHYPEIADAVVALLPDEPERR